MAIPDFIVQLRSMVGTLPLWLVGCTAVVVRDGGCAADPEILMVRRSDNGAWTAVTGIVDPGEHPMLAAVREVEEEAAVQAEVVRLAQVGVTAEAVYPNGDRTQFVDLTFACRVLPDSGDPHPADGENTAAQWVRRSGLDRLEPPVRPSMLARIDAALAGEQTARMVLLESD